MNKLAKFTALSLTAGILLTACGDGEDLEDDSPGVENPEMDDELEDSGMDDSLEDDGLEDDMED